MSKEREAHRKDLDDIVKSIDSAMAKIEVTIRSAATPGEPLAIAQGEALDDARRRAILLTASETYSALSAAKRACVALYAAQGGTIT
jgi:hypothetical protein